MTSGYARAAFAKTTLRNPGIAAVAWGGGWNGANSQGLHWVVVAGALKSGNYLIIDPIYGIGEVSPKDAILKYTTKDGDATILNNRTILTSRG